MLNTNDINQDEYNWVYEYYSKCKNNTDFEKFALYGDYLEVIEQCSLPNAIKNMTPHIELKYKYSEIENVLLGKI